MALQDINKFLKLYNNVLKTYNCKINVLTTNYSDKIFSEKPSDFPINHIFIEKINPFNLKNGDIVECRLMNKKTRNFGVSYLICDDKEVSKKNISESFVLPCSFKNIDKRTSNSKFQPSITIPEIHWFNLKNKINYLNQQNHADLMMVSKVNHEDESSKIEMIDIKAIKTLSNCEHNHKDNLLKKYFSQKRWLNLDDVFAIEIKNAFSNDYLSRDIHSKSQKIFYKVTKMEPMLYGYVDSSSCLKLESGECNSFVPECSLLHLGHSSATVIEAFGVIAKDFINMIQPFLFNHIKIREHISPNILVTLPSSSSSSSSSFKLPLLLQALAQHFNMHFYSVDCTTIDLTPSPILKLKIQNLFKKVKDLSPCILLVDNVEVLANDKEGDEDRAAITSLNQSLRSLITSPLPIIVIATTSSISSIPYHMQQCFFKQYQFQCSMPELREGLLKLFIPELPHHVHKLAPITSGLNPAQLEQLAYEVTKKSSSENDFTLEEYEAMVKQVGKSNGSVTKVARVTWDEVGGLDSVVQDVIDTIQLPIKHPLLMCAGLRRSGILFFGPPGTGKTLLAKAIATECSLNFMSVKGPELLNIYVGQTEENIRNVFKQAEEQQPTVVFFDELDSLSPNRGSSGDSGGVMDRVVSQLLAEMDRLGSRGVFIVGATNRPDLLDPALLRPGRFDKLVYVGVDGRESTRFKILKALTHKLKLAPDVDLMSIAKKTSSLMTGADLSALVNNALMECVKRNLFEKGCIDAGKHIMIHSDEKLKGVELTLKQSDFEAASLKIQPSLSMQELSRYEGLKNRFIKG